MEVQKCYVSKVVVVFALILFSGRLLVIGHPNPDPDLVLIPVTVLARTLHIDAEGGLLGLGPFLPSFLR